MKREVTVDKISEDFYALNEPRFEDTEMNGHVIPAGTPYADAYLMLGSEKAVLFDATMCRHDTPLSNVVRSITGLPVEVYFTHGHGDHVGAETASLFAAGWPMHLPVSEFAVLEDMKERFFGGTPEWMRPENFLDVKEGDTIELGGIRLETFCVPGHTPYCICYLDRANHRCIAGDAFGTLITGFSTLKQGSLQNFLDRVEAFENWVDDDSCILWNGHRVNVGFRPWTVSMLREKRLSMEGKEEPEPLSPFFKR